MSRKAWASQALALIASAGISMIIQAVAIIALAPLPYGQFSLFYLIFAVGGAAILSLVSEPWVLGDGGAPCPAYFGATLMVSLSVALIAVPVGAVSHEPLAGILAAIAIATSLYRQGSRYYSVVTRARRYIVAPDLSAICAFGVVVSGFWFIAHDRSLMTIMAAWASSGITGFVLSQGLDQMGATSLAWFTGHWGRIRYLLIDSVLLEIGSSGTAALLAPWMGIRDFGIYRSLSSAAAPVRLVLAPARPYIARLDRSRVLSMWVLAPIAGAGIGAGFAAYLALLAVGAISALQGSALMGLVEYRAAAAVFVAGNLISTFYYLVLRSVVGGEALLRYRSAVMVLSLIGPCIGWVISGLPGAMWGYALVNCVAFFVSWRSLCATPQVASKSEFGRGTDQ